MEQLNAFQKVLQTLLEWKVSPQDVSIGKPVIRGLSSKQSIGLHARNVRLENQQYGDEHGLGVNGAGIESVEVIKGPASLLYGSDALGGVLYLNPERFANSNTSAEANFSGTTYFSNTDRVTVQMRE